MLQLKNTTPFEATISAFPNEKGIETLYVIVKATFSINGGLRVADDQAPIIMEDEYWGEPGQSSLKYASELHLSKPSTDVIMIGEANAPDRRPVTHLDVKLVVADRKKVIRVFGDRKWDDGILGLRMTEPTPFEIMPLVYERAFGGVHEDQEKQQVLFESHNPIGTGFRGKRSNSEMKGMKLPNLENPEKLISKPNDCPSPACFGYIAPTWQPRKSFVGTYDEAWQQKRSPYLPDDFDLHFFNASHPDLVCANYLKGGEPVSVINMSPDGPLKFNLPMCEFDVAVKIAGQLEKPPLNLETVLLEPNDSRMSLLWRGSIECDKKTLKVEEVEINLQKLHVNGGVN